MSHVYFSLKTVLRAAFVLRQDGIRCHISRRLSSAGVIEYFLVRD